MTADPPTIEQIPFDGDNALNDEAQARDIVAFGTNTVVLATSRGITAVDGEEDSFSGSTRPDGQDPEALAFGTGRLVAGSRRIYNLGDPENGIFDTGVGGSDNKIRTMAIDAANEDLWIGTTGLGMVAFNLRDDTPLAVYTDDDSGLGSNTIRALLVETTGAHAGDVWAATDKGISRYLRQRETWIHMDEDHGLAGHLDVRALTIDTDENRRVIYGGTTLGVVYIRVP
jgi:ligand-binding sensor domain-containing protein